MAEKPSIPVLTPAQFDALVARLDEPVRDDPRLRKLMATPSRFTQVSAAQFDALVARLDDPVRDCPRLRKLMATPSRFTPSPVTAQE